MRGFFVLPLAASLERFPIITNQILRWIPKILQMSESRRTTDCEDRMPGAYSADLRERVVCAVNAGKSRRDASAVFKVSVSSAIRWAQRYKQTGGWQAKPTGGDRRSQAIEAHKDWLLALIAKEPGLALMEIRGRLAADKTFAASVSALWRFFDRHGVTFEKNAARGRTGPRRRPGIA